MPRVSKLRFPFWRYIAIVTGISMSASFVRPYPVAILQLDEVASTASVLATVRVEHIVRGSSPTGFSNRTVLGRVELVVLRAFPPSALLPGQHIQLDYEQLADENSPMNGPAVPPLGSGSVWVVALKPNPKPQSEPWRLIADEAVGAEIPAIERDVQFPVQLQNKREYLLWEVAGALSTGTREETLRESGYLTSQITNGYAVTMMQLLASTLNGDTDRWALITASLLSSTSVPDPPLRTS